MKAFDPHPDLLLTSAENGFSVSWRISRKIPTVFLVGTIAVAGGHSIVFLNA